MALKVDFVWHNINLSNLLLLGVDFMKIKL